MAVSLDSYMPFDSGAGANVMEAGWRSFMRHMFGPQTWGSGVLRGVDNTCQVYADSSGMQCKVKTGEVWIRGHWGQCTSDKTLAVAAAHATLARKDRAIARADFTNNRVEFDVLTGTASGSPSPPTLTQDTGKWEISLGIIDVDAAAVTIAAGKALDARHYIDTNSIGAVKTTDKTAVSDTAPNTDTQLAIPLSADATYGLKSCFIYSGVNGADAKFRYLGPTGATGQISPQGMGLGVPVGQTFDSIISNIVGLNADISVGAYNSGSGNKAAALPQGTIVVGNVGGNLDVAFSQQVSDPTGTVFYTGSWVELVRMR